MIENGDYIAFCEKLDSVCCEYADKTAITYMRNDGSKDYYSFGQIIDRTKQARELFSKVGLCPGDRAAIISPHSPFAVMAGLALAYANITSVLIDASLPEEEIERLLENSDVRAVFTVPAIFEKLTAALTSGIPVFNLSRTENGYIIFDGSTAQVNRPATPDPALDVIAILYSSGTTASMKGIMITYYSVLESQRIYPTNTGLTSQMNYLIALPFNHIAGYANTFQYLLTGCELGMIEDMDASKMQKALLEFKPDFFAMVPKVYEVMEQKIRQAIHEKGVFAEKIILALIGLSGFMRKTFGINIGRKLFQSINNQVFGGRMHGLGTGSSSCKESTAKFFLNLGYNWANFYSSTETNVPAISTGILDRYPSDTVGNVNRYKGIGVRISNPDADGIGEILIKTKLIMKGYFREPEPTREAFDEQGYFKTGDLGYIDRKGYLHVTGRIKEAIMLHNGKKVAPFDVDSLYGGLCPNVAIASCGVPERDEAFDEIHLFIEKNGLDVDGQRNLQNAVMAFSAQTSTLYKIARVHFIDKLPTTSVGKVKRYQLKEMALSQKTERPAPTGEKVTQEQGSNPLTVVVRIISTLAEMEQTDIFPQSRFKEDLGLDSLSMMELCVEVESAFDVLIAEDMGKACTVQDLLDLIADDASESKRSRSTYSIEDYPLPKTKRHTQALMRFTRFAKRIWRFEVSGLENISQNGNYILAPNHQSRIDGMLVWSAIGAERTDLSKICCLAEKGVLFSDQYTKGEAARVRKQFAMVGGIPLDRAENPVPAMKRCLSCLDEGYSLLMHPEGTMPLDGKMLAFKPGVAKLAIDAGVPVIPVWIDGSATVSPINKQDLERERSIYGHNIPLRPEYLKERRLPFPRLFNWRKMRRYQIRVCFGKPILPEGKNVEQLTEILENEVRRLSKTATKAGVQK